MRIAFFIAVLTLSISGFATSEKTKARSPNAANAVLNIESSDSKFITKKMFAEEFDFRSHDAGGVIVDAHMDCVHYQAQAKKLAYSSCTVVQGDESFSLTKKMSGKIFDSLSNAAFSPVGIDLGGAMFNTKISCTTFMNKDPKYTCVVKSINE